MPLAMKLTLRWEEGADKSLHNIMKIKLPRKWKEGPTSKIKAAFVDHYNEKFPEHALDVNQVHLLNSKGFQLGDEDVVLQVLEPGDLVRVKPGAAPKTSAVPKASKADNDGHITTKAALEEAVSKSKHDFDYSKWDRLDLSDDDGVDVHPNIDKASWVKLMGQQRKERRQKEDEKIQKLKAKIEKYRTKAQEIQQKIDQGEDDPQLVVDVEDAKDSEKHYQAKLDKFLATRKMVADDVCETKEERALLPKMKEQPVVQKAESPEEEAQTYDEFSKANRPIMKQFAYTVSDEASEEFLLEHPQLLCDHAEGYLLLLTLDTCMRHQLSDKDGVKKSSEQVKQERALELQVAKQHLTVHYITELAKSMKRDPRSAVRPFYRKTGAKAEDRVEGFMEDLKNFIERIRKRATDKIANGETKLLVDKDETQTEEEEEDVEYEPAGLGPGGLDPNEVLPTLPKDIQEAFIEQDTDKLRAAFNSLTDEEAQYHLKRCVDSGLWVPAGSSEGDNQEAGESTEGPSEDTAKAE